VVSLTRFRTVSAILVACSILATSTAHAQGDPISIVDEFSVASGLPGFALDASGNPVISYEAGDGLRVAHCNDPNCAGGDESIQALDVDGSEPSSLVLDADGFPVVAYDAFDGLRLAHCNDPDCSGGDESISVVATHRVDQIALELDTTGNPLIAHFEQHGTPPDLTWDLKVAHCNDPNCTGSDESIALIDPEADPLIGTPLLELDPAGNAIVLYTATGGLRLLHCDNVDCAGGDESITKLGIITSGAIALAVASGGHPSIAYVDHDPADLEPPFDAVIALLRCNDPNCRGDDELATKVVPRIDPAQIDTMSLAVDRSGIPTIAFHRLSILDPGAESEVVLARCDDTDCRERSLVSIGQGGNPALELDAAEHPMIAYYSAEVDGRVVKLAHCDDVACLSTGADMDRDGVDDVDDNCPRSTNSDQIDLDGDGIGDVCDLDLDGDGVNDDIDAFPSDPNESVDTDGDGIGNNSDDDDDGDGQSDLDEIACGSNPLDPASTSPDTNSNGIPDCVETAPPSTTVPSTELPATGSSSQHLIWLALLLMAVGASLAVGLGRRQTSRCRACPEDSSSAASRGEDRAERAAGHQ
jgi:LPXTG-motif cell wall-anchored protein